MTESAARLLSTENSALALGDQQVGLAFCVDSNDRQIY